MIYLSGAISKDPNYKVKFDFYHRALSKIFDDVIINPVVECELRGLTDWSKCMHFNLKILKQCNKMFIIKDGIESEGVKIEIAICKMNKIRYNYVYYDDDLKALIFESDVNRK